MLVSRKSNPWSSLYIIFVLGYIMFELVAIEEELLGDNLYFAMVLGLLSLAFASIISKLLRT